MLKACLNGARAASEHPALPVTPQAVGRAAAGVAAAGADAVHLHPKDASGRDSLAADDVGAFVRAVRLAAPGVPVGVTTGAWAASGPGARLALIGQWTTLPDFASVNWDEPGAEDVAHLLLERGIGVEAGLFDLPTIEAWQRWPGRNHSMRVLLELADLPVAEALAQAAELIEALQRAPHPLSVVLHGEGTSCWALLREAVRRGLDQRIGLEDTLQLPDGRRARDNEQLVRAAAVIIRG